jgi:photosystem II stability/assembly factor-like uncharacterized protein
MKNLILFINKKTISCLLFVFLFSISIQAQQGWVLQQSGTTEGLSSVWFIDSVNGFVTGANGTVLKTTNGGLNWIPQSIGTNMNFSSMYFPSSNTGFIVGGNLLVKTTNTGMNWNLYSTIYMNARSVFFIDNYIGFVAGSDTGGIIYKTDNGGLNWFFMQRFDTCFINQLFFVNTNTGFALGHTLNNVQILFKTTNGGYNWLTILIVNGIYAQFNCLFFNNIQTGYMAGSVILKTTDSGMSWNQNNFGNTINIYFPNINTGYTCGNNGTINKTSNAGVNWFPQQNTATNNTLSSIFFINDHIGFSVGFNGTIIKTTTGGEPIGIKQIGREIPKSFSLFQNYPNPFNPTTSIKYSLKEDVNVNIAVYNILGQTVKTLINEFQQAGYKELIWDGSNDNGLEVASGIYIYKIIAGDYINSKKMLLLK